MLLRLILLLALSLGGVVASSNNATVGGDGTNLGSAQGGGTTSSGRVMAANGSLPVSTGPVSESSLLANSSLPCLSSGFTGNSSLKTVNGTLVCSGSLRSNITGVSSISSGSSSSSGSSGSLSSTNGGLSGSGSGAGGLGAGGVGSNLTGNSAVELGQLPYVSSDYRGATLLLQITEQQKALGTATMQATYLVEGTSSDPSCYPAQYCYFNKDMASLTPTARLSASNSAGSSGTAGGLRRLMQLQLQMPTTLFSPNLDRQLVRQLSRVYKIKVDLLAVQLAPASQGYLVIAGHIFTPTELAKLAYGQNPTANQIAQIKAVIQKREEIEQKGTSTPPCKASAFNSSVCICNGGNTTLDLEQIRQDFSVSSGVPLAQAPNNCSSYNYGKVSDLVLSVVEGTLDLQPNVTTHDNETVQIPNDSPSRRRSRVMLQDVQTNRYWSSAIRLVATGPPAQLRATFQQMAEFMNDGTYNAVMGLRGNRWYKFRNSTRAKVTPIIRRNMLEGGSLVILNVTTRGWSCADWTSRGRWPYEGCAAALARLPSSRVQARCTEEDGGAGGGGRSFWSFRRRQDLVLTLTVRQPASFEDDALQTAQQLMADIRDHSFSFCLWAEGLKGYKPIQVTEAILRPL